MNWDVAIIFPFEKKTKQNKTKPSQGKQFIFLISFSSSCHWLDVGFSQWVFIDSLCSSRWLVFFSYFFSYCSYSASMRGNDSARARGWGADWNHLKVSGTSDACGIESIHSYSIDNINAPAAADASTLPIESKSKIKGKSGIRSRSKPTCLVPS